MRIQSLANTTEDVRDKIKRGDFLPDYDWTDAWFTRTFLPWLPTRASHQEAEALRNFAEWERAGQPGR